MNAKHIAAGFCALAIAVQAPAAEAPKPEDLIKARQAAYAFMAWNMGRIKASVEPGATFNKDEVVKAANAIAAVANSGLGATYAKGTEKGTGFRETRVKPEAFMAEHGAKLGKVAGDFNREANALAAAAATGNADTVRVALGKVGDTCKACHEDFRQK